MENSEIFLDIHNKFEKFLKKYLNIEGYKPFSELIYKASLTNPLIHNHKEELKEFAELRNAIVHESTEEVMPIAEPHKIIVEQYKKLYERITNPPKVLDIAIKAHNVFTSTLQGNVIKIMRTMQENVYTHVPILNEQGVIIGVFSESSIFKITLDQQMLIDEKTIVLEIQKHLEIKNRESEYFDFVSRNFTIEELRGEYLTRFNAGKRLGAYFVTEGGKATEKFLGLITVWDLMS